MQSPELIELILMDGCINDVDLTVILNPITLDVTLRTRTEQFCGDEMETLLQEVRQMAPNAFIAMFGYYPLTGPESDLLGIENWAEVRGVAPAPLGVTLVEALAENSAVFFEAAHTSLAQAVERVNEALGEQPAIAFVDPRFRVDNAVFGADPWLWSMTVDNPWLEALGLELALAPEDPVRFQRRIDCAVPEVLDGFLACLYSSVGHPNPAGAAAYAEAIVAELRRAAVLPAISE